MALAGGQICMPAAEIDLVGGQLEALLVPGRDGRAALLDPVLGRLHDLVARRDRMDEAHVARHQRTDLLALEQHLQGVAGLHQARHALRAAGAGEQADLDLGQADAGRVAHPTATR